MIVRSTSNIDIIQGVIGYGNAEGITDWRFTNTNTGILNILNSTSPNVRVSMLETGNVGIGTTNPASMLDVVGDTNITGIYKKNNRDVVNETSNYVLLSSNLLVPLILREVGNGSNYVSRLNTALNTSVDNTSNYVLNTSNILDDRIITRWVNTGSGIYYNASNVGIGTTNPECKLHLYDDPISDTRLTIQNNFASDRIIMFPYSGTETTKDYTFTLTEALLCDILIVGGGGGGGAGHGGGGGAGQLILIHQATLNGTYTIKVGKGGDGTIISSSGGSLTSAATKGVNSEFGNATINVIAEGGGANGGNELKDGGSGSGGDGYTTDSGVAGKGSKNTTVDTFSSGTVYSRGNDGGDGNNSGGGGQGGGGGGAGAVGTTGGNTYNTTIGHGGDGLSGISAIGYDFKTNFGNYGKLETDGNYWFAGGGAGGIYYTTAGVVSNGGKGGGGSTPPCINGTAQTGGSGMDGTGGGGAGGSAHYGSGGNGGSGIVIIRIKKYTSSTIDLIKGVPGDANTDYSITNYEGDFKIISSTSSVNTDYIKITSDGASIYNPTGSPQWSTVSDRRIKENIEKASYDKCYDNINKLELYRFNYIAELKNINKDLKQLGYIAQEVQDIFPKAVSSQEFHNDNLSIPDMLSIDIAQINYSLYGTVKKLMEMCTNKKSRLKKLEYLFETTSNIAIQDTSMLI